MRIEDLINSIPNNDLDEQKYTSKKNLINTIKKLEAELSKLRNEYNCLISYFDLKEIVISSGFNATIIHGYEPIKRCKTCNKVQNK
jgi:hypothetical protein